MLLGQKKCLVIFLEALLKLKKNTYECFLEAFERFFIFLFFFIFIIFIIYIFLIL